jgi:hypothetical protein
MPKHQLQETLQERESRKLLRKIDKAVKKADEIAKSHQSIPFHVPNTKIAPSALRSSLKKPSSKRSRSKSHRRISFSSNTQVKSFDHNEPAIRVSPKDSRNSNPFYVPFPRLDAPVSRLRRSPKPPRHRTPLPSVDTNTDTATTNTYTSVSSFASLSSNTSSVATEQSDNATIDSKDSVLISLPESQAEPPPEPQAEPQAEPQPEPQPEPEPLVVEELHPSPHIEHLLKGEQTQADPFEPSQQKNETPTLMDRSNAISKLKHQNHEEQQEQQEQQEKPKRKRKSSYPIISEVVIVPPDAPSSGVSRVASQPQMSHDFSACQDYIEPQKHMVGSAQPLENAKTRHEHYSRIVKVNIDKGQFSVPQEDSGETLEISFMKDANRAISDLPDKYWDKLKTQYPDMWNYISVQRNNDKRSQFLFTLMGLVHLL